MSDLSEKKCVPCEGGVPALSSEKIAKFLSEIPGWLVIQDGKMISRRYEFKNFARTMAFVNLVAYVATQENHHPDVEFGYNYCRVSFTTHAIDGLSENDFICAAKIERALAM